MGLLIIRTAVQLKFVCRTAVAVVVGCRSIAERRALPHRSRGCDNEPLPR